MGTGITIRSGQRIVITGCTFYTDPTKLAGSWFCHKYRRLAHESGTQQAARNMRKQGVPLNLALAVLGVRS